MLQAGLILIPLRNSMRELPRSINAYAPKQINQSFSTWTFPLYQKFEAVTLHPKNEIKKSRKKKKPTSGVIALDASGYKELKTRIVRLRAQHFDLLKETDLKLDKNPANIISSCLKPRLVSKINTCENCGQTFKSLKKLQTHLVSAEKCKAPDKVDNTELLLNYFEENEESLTASQLYKDELKTGLDQAVSTQNCKAQDKVKDKTELLLKDFQENEKSQAMNFISKDEVKIGLDQPVETKQEKTLESKSKKKRTSTKMSPELVIDPSEGKNEEQTQNQTIIEKENLLIKKVGKINVVNELLDKDEALKVSIEEKLPILIALFDIFVANNKVDEAYENFKKLGEDPHSKPYVEQVEILDFLLRGFARRCEFSKIQEIWTLMNTRKIKPTINSYISVIQSFSNSDPMKNVYKAIFNQVLKDLNQEGFKVREALDNGIFDFDDREQFIYSLRIFLNENDIGDISMKQSGGYNNDLVSSLNNVSTFKSPIEGLLEISQLKEFAQHQIKVEQSRSVIIPSILCHTPTETTETFRCLTTELESIWRSRLTKVLEQRKKSRVNIPLLGRSININQFIHSVPIANIVDVIISTARQIAENSETYSPSSGQLAQQLGTDLMTSFHVRCKTVLDTTYAAQFKVSYDKYLEWVCDPKNGAKTAREAIEQTAAHYHIVKNPVPWPYVVKMAVGRELLSLLLREISIIRDTNGLVVVGGEGSNVSTPFSSSPAFFKVYRPRKDNKDTEELKPHPSLTQLFSTNKMVDLRFSCEELPMVTPPLPWLGTSTGGYLLRSDPLVKIPPVAASEQDERIKNLPPGALNPILDSLNLLGSVPWKINKQVLEVASDIFVSRNDSALLCRTGLPIHPDKIPPPVLSPHIQDMLSQSKKPSGPELLEYRDFLAKRAIYGQIKSESYSLWCNTLYQLSVANHFKENIVWFPHNMDFRGRVYPIPTHLNHMGNDLCRSLLVFAKGKPLGKEGFEWLKLHTINLTGVKKRESVSERMLWYEEILPQILDSANNPTDGSRWWLDSDEPWQTLSACCEIRNALLHPTGPEHYVCHLPIHQDGSCNGLQHYAALGRDQLGAASVNLVPADKPQDVYSEIAAIVERKRKEDAEVGVEAAVACEGFVKRKVIKQTVMTTVYGVTRYGAGKQIARQLKDIADFPAEYVEPASKYLAAKTFESLNEMFTSSQEIQDWFTKCAKVISGECNSNVEWVTPLGFPVVQPYSRLTAVTTYKQDNMLKLTNNKRKTAIKYKKVNGRKHSNGFAPNFIHSLDSCHMMLTALHLWSQGVTYASVHDCYWTHASDVENMNKVCREQFVALHSQPILEELSELFQEKYLGSGDVKDMEDELGENERVKRELSMVEDMKREMLFINVPKKGELNLQVVKDSVYFFS